jgi:hypothetical protein
MNDSRQSTPTLAAPPPEPTEILSLPPVAPAAPPPAASGTEGRNVFREVFLLYFDPEERAIYRRGGEALYTRILASEPIDDGEPWTHARLRALARDLDFAAGYLAGLAAERDLSEPLHPDETRLQVEASLWARAARELVLALQEALGDPPGGDHHTDPH